MISKLKCPKCDFSFNYKFFPGGSLTSLRLGGARYMKCPNCGKFSSFNLSNIGKDENFPTYSDINAPAKFLIFLIIAIPLTISAAVKHLSKDPFSLLTVVISFVIIIAVMIFLSIKEGASKNE